MIVEDVYVNKKGFKCVKSQLAKTEGRDPQEYEKCCSFHKDNPGELKKAVAALKVIAPEYAGE